LGPAGAPRLRAARGPDPDGRAADRRGGVLARDGAGRFLRWGTGRRLRRAAGDASPETRRSRGRMRSWIVILLVFWLLPRPAGAAAAAHAAVPPPAAPRAPVATTAQFA